MARRESCRLHMARPRLAGCAARRLATLVLLAFRASCYDRPRVVRLHPGPRLAAHAEYEVSWTATDLGTADEAWIEFDLKHYQSMVNDGPRTALFLDELERRLAAYPPGTATVLDLGTGPFALFAKAAARLGARKVYAIEAVPASAARARKEVSDAAKYGREFAEGVVEVLEGFSTDVALPEKVDLVIFEIAGSIASEEGCYATMRDARDRFLARPDDASSYIPHAYQTLGAPATDLCHHGGGVEDPGAPVLRVQSDDATLRLLADPLLVEDIVFSAPLPARGAVPPASELAWAVDGARVDAIEAHIAGLLEPDRAAVEANGYDVADLAREAQLCEAHLDVHWGRVTGRSLLKAHLNILAARGGHVSCIDVRPLLVGVSRSLVRAPVEESGRHRATAQVARPDFAESAVRGETGPGHA